ncbi:hypothetical protein CWATWH0402_6026 [Crocosphaera watsonii WH 0402]|uniref:Uncharacterized protein n=2 Tax=Crocosphaera watsonii TaxID=263511 RepID=T2JSJ1_CROWT|nr:hypothetical protein CWATWH0005_5681 [Crocosphaera watsonii WH 0005]CCQ68014.1 hypothetical protein CWATWH0402_6026 [Crocosphaera watsonii WH 0402]
MSSFGLKQMFALRRELEEKKDIFGLNTHSMSSFDPNF